MSKKADQNKSIVDMQQEIFGLKLDRISVFSDMLNRYLQLKLRGESNWLRVHAVLFVITRGGKIKPSDLADAMLRSRNSVTNLIEGLERDGYVKRTHSTRDRRTVFIEVMPTGLNFIKAHLKELSSLEEEISTCLSPEEFQTLVDLSRKLRLALIKRIAGLKS
jgi:DNA-binding MarR family transcriptional regulator